jgi:hypothetical protein
VFAVQVVNEDSGQLVAPEMWRGPKVRALSEVPSLLARSPGTAPDKPGGRMRASREGLSPG